MLKNDGRPQFLRGVSRTVALVFLCQCAGAHTADESATRLLREPTVSKDHLAFVYAGDIWISDRDGQHPARITTDPASEFKAAKPIAPKAAPPDPAQVG